MKTFEKKNCQNIMVEFQNLFKSQASMISFYTNCIICETKYQNNVKCDVSLRNTTCNSKILPCSSIGIVLGGAAIVYKAFVFERENTFFPL